MPIPPDVRVAEPLAPTDEAAVSLGFERLSDLRDDSADVVRLLTQLDEDASARQLLSAVFATSPFLTQLVLQHAEDTSRFLSGEADALFSEVLGATSQGLR